MTSKLLSLFVKFLILVFLTGTLFVGCASEDTFDTSTPGGAFARAQYLEKEERFEEAVLEYQSVKNRFPYNKLAVASELKIADIQFNREAYIEAQHAYQLFKELHPKHPKSDYVTFQLAMSYFNQLPSTIDRDLSIAQDAMIYFDEVQFSYGHSEYAKKAKDYKRKTKVMLAEKQLYIANFYFIREIYDSALTRYEGLLKEYADYGFGPRALYGAFVSAVKTKEKVKAQKYYSQLIANHSDSNEATKAKKEYGHEYR